MCFQHLKFFEDTLICNVQYYVQTTKFLQSFVASKYISPIHHVQEKGRFIVQSWYIRRMLSLQLPRLDLPGNCVKLNLITQIYRRKYY
jgi:hypothetical protein